MAETMNSAVTPARTVTATSRPRAAQILSFGSSTPLSVLLLETESRREPELEDDEVQLGIERRKTRWFSGGCGIGGSLMMTAASGSGR